MHGRDLTDLVTQAVLAVKAPYGSLTTVSKAGHSCRIIGSCRDAAFEFQQVREGYIIKLCLGGASAPEPKRGVVLLANRIYWFSFLLNDFGPALSSLFGRLRRCSVSALCSEPRIRSCFVYRGFEDVANQLTGLQIEVVAQLLASKGVERAFATLILDWGSCMLWVSGIIPDKDGLKLVASVQDSLLKLADLELPPLLN